jgi:hypothetical protein
MRRRSNIIVIADGESDSRIRFASGAARHVLSAHTERALNLSASKKRSPFIDFHFSARRIMWIQITARGEIISCVDDVRRRAHTR